MLKALLGSKRQPRGTPKATAQIYHEKREVIKQIRGK